MIQSLVETYVTKRVVMIFAVVTNLLFLAFFAPTLSGLCKEWDGNCIDSYGRNLVELIFWAPVFLILSVVASRYEKKVFNTWIKFTIPWLLLTSIATYLAPIPESIYGPQWKGIFSGYGTIIFAVVSLFIIFVVPRMKKSR